MSFKTLNIGATALLTQRYALDTTGQNIANAATPGYSRQRLQTTAARPELHSFGALGSGVLIRQVKRVADEFLEEQVRLANSTDQYLNHLDDGYSNMEVFFNELTEHDLSTMMNKFWEAASDLGNNVEDVSTRRAIVEQGKNLRDAFQSMDQRLREYRERENLEVRETVDDINSLIAQIAELNQDIVRTESGGTTGVVANDLRDQRGERVKELSGLLNVQVIEQPNGSFTVTHASRMLVFENMHFDLATRLIEDEDMVVDMPVFADDEEEIEPDDGLLAAQITLRDDVLKGFQGELDELAAGFAWNFNRVHTQNIGLSGYSQALATNSIVDPNTTLDELQYEFNPVAGTFEIVNGNFEIVVHDTVSDDDTVLNIEIDLDGRVSPDGDEDTILWDPNNPSAPNSLVNKIQSAFDSIRPGLFQVNLDLANKLEITSLNSEYTFGFGRDTSGVLAALGLNTFFDGYDGGSFAVSDTVDGNPEMIGAARSFVAGDNTGALALLDLRERAVMDNGTSTLDDFYEGIVGRLGVEGARVDSMMETQADILTRMENQREDLSGVNMDEELTKMIQYQRSFQSAARFISTADVLYETLINM